MNIKWLGHACFLITTKTGIKILHDPYKDMFGYKLPKDLQVDYVLSSHNHNDHNYTASLQPGFQLIDIYGPTATADVTFNGILSYHDDLGGELRGDNAIYHYSVDDLTIAHLGDLGHLLDDNQLNQLKNIDILFLPVGGGYTIDGKLAAKVANQIKPKVIIPMHYRTRALGPLAFKFKSVKDFTRAYNKTVNKVKTVTISQQSIDKLADVIILDYRHK